MQFGTVWHIGTPLVYLYDHAHFGYTSTLSSLVEFEYHILPVVATCQEMSNGRQHPLKVSEHRGEITEYIKS